MNKVIKNIWKRIKVEAFINKYKKEVKIEN